MFRQFEEVVMPHLDAAFNVVRGVPYYAAPDRLLKAIATARKQPPFRSQLIAVWTSRHRWLISLQSATRWSAGAWTTSNLTEYFRLFTGHLKRMANGVER
jgi:hypothetical protein